MSKSTNDPRALATAFLKQGSVNEDGAVSLPNFRGVERGPQNGFRSLFEIDQLGLDESSLIENLLVNHANARDPLQVSTDLERLKQVTAEVKAIHKQGVLLLGERIEQAREILQYYGDGKVPFTVWLDHAFGSRKTAYNILAYCALYRTLQTAELQKIYKNLPLRAAYALASRGGEIGKKHRLLKELGTEKKGRLMDRIRIELPIDEGDKRIRPRKPSYWIDTLEKTIDQLQAVKGSMERLDLKRLQRIANDLQTLIN